MNPKMKLTSALILASVAAASTSAFASDGAVNLSGEINVQTCSINGANPNGANDFTVVMPKASLSSFPSTGSYVGDSPITFTLTGCAPTSGNVRAEFLSGPMVIAAQHELLTKYVVGDATTPLQVVILNPDRSRVEIGAPSGEQNAASVAFTGGAATLNYFARLYRSTNGVVNAGAFYTSVVYQLVYN